MVTPTWYSRGIEVVEEGEEEREHVREEISPLITLNTSLSFLPYSKEFSQPTTRLFSLMSLSNSDFVPNHIAMFNLFKQLLMFSEESTLSRSSIPTRSDDLRHCHTFLHFLVYSLASLSSREMTKCDLQLFGDSISTQLETVYTLVCQLSESSKSSNAVISLTPTDMHPYTHLLIDTKMHLLLSHHYIARLIPEFEMRIYELIKSIWTDLLERAFAIFSIHSDLLRLNFSPFNSYSFIELWCLSAHLSGRKTSDSNQCGFWDSFIPFLLSFSDSNSCFANLKTDNDSTSLLLKKNKLFWWLLLNLSRVLPRSVYKREISCWEICREGVVALASLHSDGSSAQIAFSLWSLIQLCKFWGPSMDSVMILWDSFSKKLGEVSHLTNEKNNSVKNVSELRYLIINDPSEVSNPLQVSSFELFLRFFSLQFNLIGVSPHDCWKQYKGRFYSKLSFRRLQNIKSDSIIHLYLLTFILSHKTDVNDVIDKSSEIFLKLLSSASIIPSVSLLLIWECLLGLFNVFTDQSLSLSSYLSKILPKLCEYQNISMFDTSYAKSHWDVCNLVWLDLPELCSCAEQTSSVLQLLQELYVSYYSAFHSDHIVVIASNITQVLTSVYNLLADDTSVREPCRGVCTFFWEFGYPSWRQDHLSDFSVPEMGPLISRLILLSLSTDFSPTISFSDVFKEVLFCNNLSCQVGSRFIQVFMSEEVGNTFISQNQMFTQLFIKAWLLYIIQSHRYPQFTASLVSCTNQLRVLSTFGQTSPVSSLSEVIFVFESYLKGIRPDKDTLRESQFFISELLEWIEPHLCDPNTSKECLFAIYRIASCLVRYCPAVIYSRTQTHCILPRLIEHLFFPTHSLSKPPHPVHLDCVREFLVEFLLSLFDLQSENDQFIQRKIRQLFSKYFTRFQQQSQGNGLVSSKPNPFLSLFSALQTDTRAALCALSVIRELFLKLPQPPSNLLPTLLFLRRMTEVANNELLANSGEYLLFPMLGCLLACNACLTGREPHQIRELTENIIRKIITSVTSSCHRIILVESINAFVAANMSSCHGKVFTTLKFIAQLDPRLLAQCISEFHSLLLEFERNNAKLAAEIRIELNKLESTLNQEL